MSNLFLNKGFISSGILNLSPKETYFLCKDAAIIVDVREAYMNRFKMFGVKNLMFCPKSILADNINNFPRNKPLILADSVGLKSKEAVLLFQEKGFKNIANMAGGLVEWERDGLPIIINKNEKLSGSCMCQLKPRERKK